MPNLAILGSKSAIVCGRLFSVPRALGKVQQYTQARYMNSQVCSPNTFDMMQSKHLAGCARKTADCAEVLAGLQVQFAAMLHQNNGKRAVIHPRSTAILTSSQVAEGYCKKHSQKQATAVSVNTIYNGNRQGSSLHSCHCILPHSELPSKAGTQCRHPFTYHSFALSVLLRLQLARLLRHVNGRHIIVINAGQFG